MATSLDSCCQIVLARCRQLRLDNFPSCVKGCGALSKLLGSCAAIDSTSGLCWSGQIRVLNSPGLLPRKLVGSLEQKASRCQDGELNIIFNVTAWAGPRLPWVSTSRITSFSSLHRCLHNSDQAFKLIAPPRGVAEVEFHCMSWDSRSPCNRS